MATGKVIMGIMVDGKIDKRRQHKRHSLSECLLLPLRRKYLLKIALTAYNQLLKACPYGVYYFLYFYSKVYAFKSQLFF